MAPINALQPTFSGGEFAPSLYSRVDLSKYGSGLKTARNFFIHPHGGASNRQGTEFIAATKDTSKKSRLIPFEFSLDQAYVLDFGHQYVRFYKPDGLPVYNVSAHAQFSPSATYSANSTKKVGDYHEIDFGSGKKLYIMWAYGENIYNPDYPSAKWKFKFITNTSDNLAWGNRVFDSDGDYLQYVMLANGTPSKNTAKLIQDLIRFYSDNFFPELANVVVTANAAYGAAPAISADTTPAPWIECDRAYSNASTVTGNADNVSSFPPAGAPWTLNTTPYEVVTPFTEGDLPDLKFAQSADVMYLVHPRHTPRTLSRLGEDSWAIAEFAFKNGPFMPSNASGTTMTITNPSGSNYTMTASSASFVSRKHNDSIWQIRHDIAGQKATTAFTSATAGAAIKCGLTWRIITHGTWTGAIQVEKSTDGGSTWTSIRSFSSANDNNVNTYGEVLEPCLVRARCTAYTSGTINVDLTTDPYEHIGIVKINTVTSTTVADVSIVTEVGTLGAATTNWAEGSWSNVNGWPRAVMFYQDRLCFAGSYAEPQTIWMSQTGIYDDFGRSSPLLDTDGITVNLPSRKLNGVKNLLPLGDVLAMTASAEWSIGPGSSGVITPTSVTQRVEGNRGCATVDPVVIGNRALYFQPMGSVLRDLGYTFESNGYDGDDLTVLANHLFDQHSIVDMAYQQEPDSLLWCVREDGKLLTLTYLREQEVFAWTWHETDGQVESVCSIPGNGYNEVWFVVKRTINGSTKRYIERLTQRMTSTAPADQIFMDCAKTYSGAATTSITGLSHLEGKAVAVLADGNVVTGKTVTSGAITLTTAASKVHVGLPYTCDLETLNVELNLNTGTTQGTQVKISEVMLRFLNSRGGQVGPDAANLDTIVTRTSEPLGSPTSLYSGDVKLSIASGYDVGGRIFFRQANPLPTTILAIIPVVTVGG